MDLGPGGATAISGLAAGLDGTSLSLELSDDELELDDACSTVKGCLNSESMSPSNPKASR